MMNWVLTITARHFNVKRIVFSTNGVETIEYPYAKKEIGLLPYIIYNNELKMDHRHICKG